MKKENNNIEHLFKDKLQEFEVMPPEHLWANISQEIAPKKEQKKPFLFWYLGGGIAASLVIFTTLFSNFSSTQHNNTLIVTNQEEYCPEESPLVHTQEVIQVPKNISNTIPKSNPIVTKASTINSGNSAIKNSITGRRQELIESKDIIDQKNNPNNNYASAEDQTKSFIKNKETPIKKTEEKTTATQLAISKPEELSDNELLALLQKEKKEVQEKEKTKRWSLQPQVTTFSYNGNGSSINSTFENNPQDTKTDLSYGMRIAYQATPKISLRMGINNANINITTSDIGIKTSSTTISEELFSNDEVAIIDLNSSGNSDFQSDSPDDSGSDNSAISGKISQQLKYIEIPIEIAYKVIDKKIGMDLIGGFSTFLLSENKSTFESQNGNTSLGKTSSANTTSYSSNFGFSVDYSLVKNLKFSIEPMLKFQLNSFNNTTDYQPYFLGISSGLKWNF